MAQDFQVAVADSCCQSLLFQPVLIPAGCGGVKGEDSWQAALFHSQL